MDEITRVIGDSNLQCYDPFDVLYHINPEIASIAYARKADILTPDLFPLIARFRELQSDERIAVCREITKRLGIDADERKHNRSEDGLNLRTRIQADTLDGICAREQAGMTERERIQSQRALNLQKIKYETMCLMEQNYCDVKRHISNNKLAATKIEAEALASSIKYSAQASRDAQLGVARIDREARIREQQIKSAYAIAKAEKMRDIASIKQRGEIIKVYIGAQAEILRTAATGKAQFQVEGYRTLQVFAQEGARLLQGTERDYVRVFGRTDHGSVELEIDLERRR